MFLKSLTNMFPLLAFFVSLAEKGRLTVDTNAPMSTLDRHCMAVSLMASLLRDLMILRMKMQQIGLIRLMLLFKALSKTSRQIR